MIGTYGDNDSIRPDQVRHGLDDRQAYLWVGHYRIASSVTASDDELHADLILADKLAAEAAFMASDIRGLLERRAAERADAENEAHEQHAEPVTSACGDHHMAEFWMNDEGTVLCALCDGPPPGLDDVLVAGDALADLPEPPAVPVAGEHEVIYIDASDLGEKEGAFERFVETTAAEHKRAREAGEQ